ncbi:MAG: Nif3-like dinuclear metal center hexameric protein [Bacteroidales bacterium]|nr:Nif3-like dinuclear metal center hexameric protein [Bacteroidales bacterium]
MKVKEIISALEEFAPPQLQEDYDNTGLNIGNPEDEIKGILLCIDIIPEVIDEAIENACNLIISHHPLIFGKIKKITGSNYVEKSIIKAIKNDISIYCGHTSFDSVEKGVSYKICEKLGLKNLSILAPKQNILKKIAVFVPKDHAKNVREAMTNAGAGSIGNYDSCSFNTLGEGSFRANLSANPFVGNIGEIHFESEVKIEMIFPEYLQSSIVSSIIAAHPYEEVAYDIYKLENSYLKAGLGMIGHTESELDESEILSILKSRFELTNIRHGNFTGRKINKIAVCGGSGASFINHAIRAGAQVFISGDIKYHDYFLAENKILIIDIGHFESEQYTKEIFYDIIKKKNPNFAVQFSKINTNPIKNY